MNVKKQEQRFKVVFRAIYPEAAIGMEDIVWQHFSRRRRSVVYDNSKKISQKVYLATLAFLRHSGGIYTPADFGDKTAKWRANEKARLIMSFWGYKENK